MATITIEAPIIKDLKYVIEDAEVTAELVKTLEQTALKINPSSGKK